MKLSINSLSCGVMDGMVSRWFLAIIKNNLTRVLLVFLFLFHFVSFQGRAGWYYYIKAKKRHNHQDQDPECNEK